MKYACCPACHRQFDVTTLLPGTPLRCLCDVVFKVHATEPYEAESVRCGSCGAAIPIGSSKCLHCAAGVDLIDRNMSTVCPKCGGRNRNDAEFCSACGIAIEPQALAPLPEGKACPRCAGVLRIRIMPEGSVVECAACLGLWLAPQNFTSAVEKAKARGVSVIHDPTAKPAVDRRPFRYVKCLVCDDLMVPRNFGKTSGILIDVCGRHGVWLDHTELEAVIRYVETHPHLTEAIPDPAAPSSKTELNFPSMIHSPVYDPSRTWVDVVFTILSILF